MKRIVIVGGGISGLTIAYNLTRSSDGASGKIAVTLLEGSDRAGGNLRSERSDGYIFEWGPNGFLDAAPATLVLVEALELRGELAPCNASARQRFIVRGGRLRALPAGPLSFLTGGALSWSGKARVLLEPLARRRDDGADESVQEFASRRIGGEAASVLVDALVTGIYGGDPARLSLRACFPKLWAMESEHGGLFRGLLARRAQKKRGAGLDELRPVPGASAPAGSPTGPAGLLTSFRDGIETLPRTLVAALGGIVRTGARVASLEEGAADSAHLLRLESGETLSADAVVVATPAHVAARILSRLDAALAGEIAGIASAPIAVVGLAFAVESLPRPLDGFGFLVPGRERGEILGCLWDSSIYPGRAPAGHALLRAMVGGARDPEAAALDDAKILARVQAALGRYMGLTARPDRVWIARHPHGIPQYEVGHLARLARIDTHLARHPGLPLAGSSYRGVAMNACIDEARSLAPRIVDRLS